MPNNESRPVIVLGAARSGTKMIRDAIASHPNMVAIPHDVNFIWKYGNYHIRHDELTPADVTTNAAAFIHRFFERFRKGRPDMRVVEKTVGNTVRVGFVRKVFPSCQFVHVIRDGRDVAVSMMRQWQAPLDMGNVLDKLKYFPAKALSTYAIEYALSYLVPKLRREGHVAAWGVTLQNLGELVRRYSLLEVCGLQWRRCVELAVKELTSIPPADRIEVRYEEFVQNPLAEMERIIRFLGLEMPDEVVRHVAEQIKHTHIGKWKRNIPPDDLKLLMPHISATMQRLGYLDGQESKELSARIIKGIQHEFV